MNQVTVKDLALWLSDLVKKGYGDKRVVIADDTEGNAYHGMYYSPTSEADEVKDLINSSNGLYESQETDCTKIVIIG